MIIFHFHLQWYRSSNMNYFRYTSHNLTNCRSIETHQMTDGKLYMSLSTNTIVAKQTNHIQQTRLVTSSTDKHYSLDSEEDLQSGCQNIGHQQLFFSELPSPRRSHYTNYRYLRRLEIVFIFPRLVLQILFQIQVGLSCQCEIYHRHKWNVIKSAHHIFSRKPVTIATI